MHEPRLPAHTFAELLHCLAKGLPERELAVGLSLCAALAGESVFLYGPPGTAKSLVARRLHFAFEGARVFDYLMGRFSTPEELFGPLSIARLRDEDRYERRYAGYLPDADIVFLDEVWKAGPPIQNALLTALNEKIWRNGDTEVKLPLKCLIGASNELAEDESSLAFWDRFLVRIPLEALKQRASFGAMLSDGEDVLADPVPRELKIRPEQWLAWQGAIKAMPLGERVIDFLWQLRSSLPAHLAKAGPSDRRWKKIAGILKASAFMHGRDTIQAGDLLILPWCLWDEAGQWPGIQQHCLDSIARLWFAGAPEVLELERLARMAGTAARQGSPLVVDDEYYLIDAPDIAGPQRELRIWNGDFQDLGFQEREVDVFVHSGSSLVATRTLALAKGNEPWTLRCGERSLRLRSQDADPALDSDSPSLADLLERFQAQLTLRQTAEVELAASFWFNAGNAPLILGPWDKQLGAISAVLSERRRHG